MRNYVTEKQGAALNVNYDYKQSWLRDFSFNKTRNESLMVKYFKEHDAAQQEVGLNMLIFLSQFWFATRDQIKKALEIKGLDASLADEVIDDYVANRVMNCFTFAAHELDVMPPDAMRIYCMDHGARHILSHYYREDFVYWQSTDNLRGTEQIVKCLSTSSFYLSLARVKMENLRTFEPIFDVSIGRRNARFSAMFEILNKRGGDEPSVWQKDPTRKFILESVRSYDLPAYWQKKCREQIHPYLMQKFWQQNFPEEPMFILLAETDEAALEAADIFHRITESANFRITTDKNILRGMEKAPFYKYIPCEESARVGTLQPGRAVIFSKKDA